LLEKNTHGEESAMLLTNALIEQVRCDGPGGGKYNDEKGMYLYVTASSKSWRMDYRFAGKRATITLGTWPRVTLQLARALHDTAREKLAKGIDPMAERHRERAYATQLTESSFEKVAERWLVKTAEERSPRTQAKVVQLLRRDVFPCVRPERIGHLTSVDMLASSNGSRRAEPPTWRIVRGEFAARSSGKQWRHPWRRWMSHAPRKAH
jgi:hypothetical protein